MKHNVKRKLDNTAKIFSLSNSKSANIFRYSVILKENINPNKLSKALNQTLEELPAFRVNFGTGLFWHYLKFNPKPPLIKEEGNASCNRINLQENNNYLFKVTYYQNKINLDVFHALTDGTGAITFLKTLLYNYLNLMHKLPKNNSKINIGCEDLSLKYHDKNYKQNYKVTSSYQIPGRVDQNINNTNHYIVNINTIKKVCIKHNATITEYLTALYIYSLYLSIYNKNSTKDIIITIPISLRNIYQEDTLSNFFTYTNITANIINKEKVTFTNILKHIQTEFKEKITKEKAKEYLARDINLGMNIGVNFTPLFIKKIFIKLMGKFVAASSTSTLSNVGIIDIEEKYKKYIDNIYVIVMPGNIQKIKCTVCTFEDKLNITINSNINDTKFIKTFQKLLKKHLK